MIGYDKSMNSSPHVLYLPRPSRIGHYVRSRLRPYDIELDTVKAVLAQYNLALSSPPTNLPLSRRTQNVVVRTDSGKKVVKRYRSRHPETSIIYGHSILAHLSEIGFPAPRLELTPDGRDFINYAGKHYAVFKFLDGKNYSLNSMLRKHRLTLMGLAGSTLASLHQALEGFMPQGSHNLGFSSFSGGWQRGMDWFTANVSELIEKSRGIENEEEKQYANWLVEHSQYILEELSSLDDQLSRHPLPRTIIHGDYGLHNLFFHKDGKITVMDFESARLEWRLSDLVSCLSKLRLAKKTYDFESMCQFMDHYQSVYPLQEEEWSVFAKVWRFYKLRSALIYWNNYIEVGGPLRKLFLAQDGVIQANWIRDHPDALLQLNAKTRNPGPIAHLDFSTQ